MSHIGISLYSIKTLGVALAIFLSTPLFSADLGILPFDHRRLLLVQMEKTEIPTKAVLSQILDEMRVRGRYQWVLASRPGDPVAPVLVPRDFSWDSPPSVKKMAQKYGVDGVLWIQQRDQEVLLKWYDGKEGLPLIFDATYLRADSKKPEEESARLTAWMDTIWARFPGVGFVAKRDSKYLYFEGASENKLKEGMVVSLLRVESVTRHNLFKTLADFKTSTVGKAKIIGVENLLAKGEVTEESALDPVRMGDRYAVVKTVASSKSETDTAKTAAAAAATAATSSPVAAVTTPAVRGLGSVSLGLGYGRTSHANQIVGGPNLAMTRNAPALDFAVMANVTSQWIAWLDYRYRFATFINPSSEYNQASINAKFTSLGMLGGFRFRIDGYRDGLWLAPFLGFRSYSFASGTQTYVYGPSSKKLNGLAVGIHLNFPLAEVWSLRFNASKSMFIAYSELELLSGGSPQPTAAEVAASVHYSYSPTSTLGAGFRYQNIGVKYTGAGTRGSDSESAGIKVSEVIFSYEQKF